MNSQPNMFDKVSKDPLLYKIVRQSFRVPVDDPGIAWVKIENIQYPVCDICLDGIGITLEPPSIFSVSQMIMDCELKIADQHITGLNGRVVHFSLNSGRDWQCGIQWIALRKEVARQMADIVSMLKDDLFKNDYQTG
ncbi:MAG: hypothetical protein ABIJ31_16145 [Pseudomonadota bacterium]